MFPINYWLPHPLEPPAPPPPPTPNEPLGVDIINHIHPGQSWLPPLLGLVGSILVALVALYSVRKSNGTNERAIQAADSRERQTWHRDNLLRLASESLRVAREVQQNYVEAAAACIRTSDLTEVTKIFRQHMDSARAAIDRVVPLSYEIDLLGESRLALELLEFRETAVFISPAVEQFHSYLVANINRLHPRDTGDGRASMLTGEELHETLEG
jgi:hypothetical protein